MRLIDADELQAKLRQLDWQDVYLPVHFDNMIDECKTIDKDVILQKKEQILQDLKDIKDSYKTIKNMLDVIEKERKERKKGKWLRDPPEGGYALYKCSVCGKCWSHWWASAMTVEEMTKEVRCCPNCGADMREEKQDAEIH